MYKRKYRPGRKIIDIGEIFNLPATNPGQLFYFGSCDRPKHWKVIWNMQGMVIMNAIRHGCLWVAEKIEEEKA